MPFIAALSILIQLYFAVHAGKRGRYYWIYIIMFFPFVGSAAYFFIHVLPEMRYNSSMQDAGNVIMNAIAPTRRITQLKKNLEFTDTVENRQLLAKEYMTIKAYDEAITLYESCLEGIFKNEPDIIFELSQAYFFKGLYEKARERLLQIKNHHSNFRYKEALLLLAQTYEALNETSKALTEYEGLIDVYPGEEARCRYALLLKKSGKTQEATQLFHEIIQGVKHSPHYYRRAQKEWTQIAEQNLMTEEKK